MLFMSVAIVEPPLEVLDIVPPDDPLPPLEVLDVAPPDDPLPPELEVPELLVGPEPELPDPPELLPPGVFKPGPELLPLPEDAVPPPLVDEPPLLPELLPEMAPPRLVSSPVEPLPPPAQPGAHHPTAPTSKANMQPDSVRSNRFTGDSLRREEAAH
jgi:hypothetical protein